MSEAADFGRVLVGLGHASFAFGLMFAIAITNRHMFSPVAGRRLPAFAALLGAVTLGSLALMLPARTPGWAAFEVAVFATLLWGLWRLAAQIEEGSRPIAVALALSAVGMVCTRAADYVR